MQLLFNEFHKGVFFSLLVECITTVRWFKCCFVLEIGVYKKSCFQQKLSKPSTGTCVPLKSVVDTSWIESLFFFFVWCECPWQTKHKLCTAMLKFFWVQMREPKLRRSLKTLYFLCSLCFTAVHKKKPDRTFFCYVHSVRSPHLVNVVGWYSKIFCLFTWVCSSTRHLIFFLLAPKLCAMFATLIKSVTSCARHGTYLFCPLIPTCPILLKLFGKPLQAF